MAIDLSDYAESLRREIEPLGGSLFAAITNDTLTKYLADAFWEARLDGFLAGYSADEEGVVEPVGGVELSRAAVALIVLYAGIRVLRNRILNINTGFRAKAGSVEFEQQNSATMLAEMLKQLRDRKNQLIDRADELGDATSVLLIDAFSTRLLDPVSYGGGPELTTGG